MGPTEFTGRFGFDEKRILAVGHSFVGKEMAYWDGKSAAESFRDGYVSLGDSPDGVAERAGVIQFSGRNGQRNWWSMPESAAENAKGRQERYTVLHAMPFHGVDCYVLEADGQVPPSAPSFCDIGVADHRLHGIDNFGQVEWYADYKEIAPGCWFPMTIGRESWAARTSTEASATPLGSEGVTDIAVNKGLPEKWFAEAVPEGTRVHEERSGKTYDYVFAADQVAGVQGQVRKEMDADAARRALFAPPAVDLKGAISLGERLSPLPVNPLALSPAAEFPADAKWMGGKQVKLADLRGKVVLIVFWASWADFAERDVVHGDRPDGDFMLPAAIRDNVAIVGVHAPTEDAGRVQKAMQKYDMDFPVCIDEAVPEKGWGTMAEKYRVEQTPTTYVIDADGKVAALGRWSEAVDRAKELLGVAGDANGDAVKGGKP